MGKRKRRKRAAPTLFDLPLHTSADEPDAEKAPAEPVIESSSPQSAPTSSQREANDALDQSVTRGPSIFDRDGMGEELEQIELGSATAVLPRTENAGQRPVVSAEEEAFLGDRLLSGLADLAAQLIALGLVIAAVHSMGLIVTIGDWQPFGVLALVFSFLYWCVPLAFWGQTPGMAWVGHLARSSSGEPLSFGQTFLRWLGSVLTLALAGLPLLLTLTGRSFTDRISDSRTNVRG